MATKEQLMQARNDPNVIRFLNLISRSEGTTKYGYNTAFGNTYFGDFSKHPNLQKQFTQTDGKVNRSGASGRYQFIKKTWDGVARKYGLNDFSPLSQDIGALSLIADHGALESVKKGDFKTAIDKLGTQWASFPSAPESYKQHKRSYQELLGKNYEAELPPTTLNGALNRSPESVELALNQIQSQFQPVDPVYAVQQSALNQVAKAPNPLEGLYSQDKTLGGALGIMTNPTPSPQNIGFMTPLASVLFRE